MSEFLPEDNADDDARCKHVWSFEMFTLCLVRLTRWNRWNQEAKNPMITKNQKFAEYYNQPLILTRKSSYINARGIPPAAYQVRPLLFYPGGTPSLVRGVPHTWQWDTPSLAGGTHPWLGMVPQDDPAGVNLSTPSWPGRGTPHPDLAGVSPFLTWTGYTPLPLSVDKQTESITFPHPSVAGGKNPGLFNCRDTISSLNVQVLLLWRSNHLKASSFAVPIFISHNKHLAHKVQGAL